MTMLPEGWAAPLDYVGARRGDGAGSFSPVRPQTGELLQPTDGTAAGNGGSGLFDGVLTHRADLDFAPTNEAFAFAGGDALAWQANGLNAWQGATQIGGIGGHGGDGNHASGGLSGPATGGLGLSAAGSGAGLGGDGHFSGGAVNTSVVLFHPLNLAAAGAHADAQADQVNVASIQQSATQIAGVGGDGGSGNVGGGGPSYPAAGLGGVPMLPGGAQAGAAGDGFSAGSLVHAAFAVYVPINIAVAGPGSKAHAEQTNDVTIDQHAIQMAGIGGSGGSGNLAESSDASGLLHLIGGSDVIAPAHSGAGNGGGGFFAGALSDVDIAVYAPVNIAIAGFHATADAHQYNDVHIGQGTTQIAGVGGHGGDGNLALEGHVLHDLFDAIHLLG